VFWIVSTIFLTLIAIGAFVARRQSSKDKYVKDLPFPTKIIQWVAIGLIILITGVCSVDQIENGHVGLVYQFGAIVGQRNNSGPVIHAPWQSVQQQNTQLQSILPPSSCSDEDHTPHCLDAASSETQDVFVTPVINIHVDSNKIQTLFKTVGPDYINVLVDPRVAQVTKEEVAKYKATDVIPNREKLRETIAKRLTEELSSDSITVDDFLLTNVHFSKQFNTAIEASQEAAQNAKKEQNNVVVVSAQSAQKVAAAQGDADARKIAGQGEASYNAEIAASLTPEMLQYLYITKLSPDVKVIMMPPSDNGLMFNMGNLVDTTSDQPTK